MAMTGVFSPGATVSISCSTTSASATIATGFSVMRLTNVGSVPVFVRWGTGTQTAVATDFPVPANSSVVVAKPFDVVTVAAITGSSTATLYVTVGEGTI